VINASESDNRIKRENASTRCLSFQLIVKSTNQSIMLIFGIDIGMPE